MDQENNDVSRWVDTRLSALDPGAEWKPNAERALARVRTWNHARKHGRHAWLWATLAATASVGVLLMLASPSACANPSGCARGFWDKVFSAPSEPVSVAPAPVAAVEPPAAPAPAPVATAPAPPQKTVPAPAVKDYKSAGTVMAPITIEVYTDYECPHCAALYRDVVPQLIAEFVNTGRARLVHRDYPLPQHAFARLAARYANAAGQLGHYEAVVNQIFQTQEIWAKDGDIGAQVAKVLPAAVMEQVRALVKNDPHLDDTIATDMAEGVIDNLTQTPTMVIVSKDKRQTLPGVPAYPILKSYLDNLLAH